MNETVMFLFSFSFGPLPYKTLCHTHISSIYLVVTFYFRFMNENISRAQALEHNVTIMNLFSVLLKKSFSLTHTVTAPAFGRSYFKRIGISTNNDVRRCYVHHDPCTYVRACVYVCMRCL